MAGKKHDIFGGLFDIDGDGKTSAVISTIFLDASIGQPSWSSVICGSSYKTQNGRNFSRSSYGRFI